MDYLTAHITCDVELDTSGPNIKTVAKWTADALRKIADAIEADSYEDGHHEVTDGSGRPIGSVSFDFSESDQEGRWVRRGHPDRRAGTGRAPKGDETAKLVRHPLPDPEATRPCASP